MSKLNDFKKVQEELFKLEEEIKKGAQIEAPKEEEKPEIPGLKYGPMAHIAVICGDNGKKICVDIMIHVHSFEIPEMVDDRAHRFYIKDGKFVKTMKEGPANEYFEKKSPGKAKISTPIAVQTLEAWTKTHYPAHLFNHCVCDPSYTERGMGHDEVTCRARGIAAYIADIFWQQKGLDGIQVPEKFL